MCFLDSTIVHSPFICISRIPDNDIPKYNQMNRDGLEDWKNASAKPN